jgi:hypothetical protein
MHCSELPNSQLTTVLHHRPRLKRRMSFLSYGLWQIHYKRAPRSVMAVGSRRWVSKGTDHAILSRKANAPYGRFSESSEVHRMRNLPRDNASPCPPFFSSITFLPPRLVCPKLIGSDSFSCLTLQDVDAGLRAQHLRLITDVWVSTCFFATAALMPTGTCDSQVLRLERADAEVSYRALVGLGNVVS